MAKRESRQSILSEGARLERYAVVRWARRRQRGTPKAADHGTIGLDILIAYLLSRDERTGRKVGGVGRR